MDNQSLRPNNRLGWLTAAVLLVVAAFVFYRASDARRRADARIAELVKQVEVCSAQAGKLTRQQEIIALLGDRNTRAVVLVDGPGPKLTATIWYNAVRREAALDINSLPAPEPGKYFQCWAIVDGQPLSLGMVVLRGEDSWQTLPFVEKAQAFAISAEDNPQGGSMPRVVVLSGPVG